MNVKVERPYRNGIYASASYLYNDATSVNDGTSSTAASQFGNNPVPGDANDPPVTLSNYATGHRVNLAASYTRRLFAGVDTTVSLFYNGQSGLPFKYIFASAATTSTATRRSAPASAVNDLLYVPRERERGHRARAGRGPTSTPSSRATPASESSAARSWSATPRASTGATPWTSGWHSTCPSAAGRRWS